MQGGNLPALVADVRRNKALATVLERPHVTDASGNAGRPASACGCPTEQAPLAEAEADAELRRRRTTWIADAIRPIGPEPDACAVSEQRSVRPGPSYGELGSKQMPANADRRAP